MIRPRPWWGLSLFLRTFTPLLDADCSWLSVHRQTRDAHFGERSAEQDLANRHEEKSLRDYSLVPPLHNCVLSNV
ncbi:hypothetical protein DFH94DRAFT_708750 [Russula ochroleuca]|uniref:Secreted protein n=1 Tax=Russula ochroleuca TaxID=152965 RepID=A0A9P5TCY0_9AGAM|nr:hypothetical protein DFH94DRAFT_708750 [Russula ochroleuca]